MSTSKYLTLYTDSKDAVAKLTIDASSTYVSMNSSSEFHFEKDVSIKNGATYKNVNVAFQTLDTYNTNFYQEYQDDLKVDRDKSILEISDRKAADSTLTTNLNAEIVLARANESKLTTDLASEVTLARSNESKISVDLASEITLARSNESKIATDLASEITLARSNESKIATDLASEVTLARSNESKISVDLASETKNREDRDVLLTNKINGEFADLYNRMLYLESVVASLRNEAIYVAVQALHSNV